MNLRVFLPATKADFYRCIARQPDGRYEFEGGRIEYQTNDVIALPQLGIALSVAEIYRGIELSSEDTAPNG